MKEQVLLNTNNMLVIITHFSNENSNTATYHYSVVVKFFKLQLLFFNQMQKSESKITGKNSSSIKITYIINAK